MNRRQKIIVSITGIFIILLALVGLTYAYFLTRITGNENDKSISVTTANLELLYGDGNNVISMSNIMPGDPIPVKTFSVTNNGNATVENYKVYLESVQNQLELKDDLKYTLTCKQFKTSDYESWEKSTDENKNITDLAEEGTCTGKERETFPSVMNLIGTNTINVGYTQYYELQLEYLYQDFDQSIDMNKLVQAKVNIYDEKTKFLTTEIMNDNRITKNTTSPTFSGVETEEKGLYTTLDDYGTSYYFRGAQSYNYVNFAGYTWRIVRINGDGSIRLILNDGLRDENNNLRYKDTLFGHEIELINDNTNVGYMHGAFVGHGAGAEQENLCVENNGQKWDVNISDETLCINGEWISTYDATHDNIFDSYAKMVLDDFYEKKLKTNYAEYLSDTMFCGDKELASTSMKEDNTGKGYGRHVTYYAASERLTYDSNGEDTTIATPTLKCANNATNDYSRYTVDVQTLTNITTNGDLTYPIGMISADEIVFAGGWNGAGERANSTYYLSLPNNIFNEITNMGNVGWWTMTPKYYKTSTGAAVYSSTHNTYSNYSLNTNSVDYTNMIRPVINLRADILVSGTGDGSQLTPYELTM